MMFIVAVNIIAFINKAIIVINTIIIMVIISTTNYTSISTANLTNTNLIGY